MGAVLEQLLYKHFIPAAILLVLANALLCAFVIARVPYTEIDWVAYMDEVSGVINDNEFDYIKLRGGTGPLVYPAGFVYIYSLLYYLTDRGRDLLTAQTIFAILHCLNLCFVLFIYRKSYRDASTIHPFPLWIVAFLVLSRRVMSLFVLRLFNDAVQMLLMHAAICLFISNRWSLGCFVYSLSVSIKMNALLFAPGLAVLLCQARGTGGAIRRILGICFTTQVILGAPFLLHAPKSYVARAFELTREFMYKWSVNGALLKETTFLNKRLAMLLLLLHLTVLILFGHFRWTAKRSKGLLEFFHLSQASVKDSILRIATHVESRDLNPSHVAGVLFTSNFIGIAFARTLHYQFYLWYAHALPMLVCRGNLMWMRKLTLLVTIEAVFNIYPPEAIAAVSLHVAHLGILISLWIDRRATDASIFKDGDNRDSLKSSNRTDHGGKTT